MFCDLVGSTALRRGSIPKICAKSSARITARSPRRSRFDGFVAKYMGDGVLIYFGYPQAHEDDAERAVRAGLGVIDASFASMSNPPSSRRASGLRPGWWSSAI